MRAPGGSALLLLGLGLCALALRPQLVGLSPLLPRVEADLGLSHTVAGLLVTIPVLCMGVCAPLAPALLRRVGSVRAIALCLTLIALGGLARAGAPAAAALLALTFVLGAGMGLAGALLPVVVKEGVRSRPAFATGVYVTGINLGSALSSAGAIPLAGLTGGWRGPLAIFSLATAALVPLWLVVTRRLAAPAASAPVATGPVARSGVVWVLVLLFSTLGVTFYGLNAWLPDAYTERGWSEAAAGGLVAVLNIAALPASLAVPYFADRRGSRRAYLLGAAVVFVAGTIGLAALPGGAWLWVVLCGTSNGALFALLLTLPLDVADRPASVGAIAGLMLGVGYCVAALSPVVLGAVRDATGSFTAVLWLIAACALLLVAGSHRLTPLRLRAGAERLQVGAGAA